MKHALLLLLSLGLLSWEDGRAYGAEIPTLRVWPGQAPGEKGDIGPERYLEPTSGRPVKRLTDVSDPTIAIHRPAAELDCGTAVLVCPGGGYHILATDLEGDEVAEWLNTLGVTAFVLKYRVPRREGQSVHLAPLQDAQRAMSLIRSRAKEWGIDADRIGVLGFSAGGHLSAAACTNFDKRAYATIDDIDRTSCRPDFAVLVYPAYLAVEGTLNLAPEITVSSNTPRTFLAHAADDPVSCESSLAYFTALLRAKVPVEMHLYASGGHGFGLRPSEDPCSSWPERCTEWMRSQGLLSRAR